MRPGVGHHGDPAEGRGTGRADQARRTARRTRLLPALLPALALAACGGIPRDVDPRVMVGNLFGAHLEGREPPPGLDQPWPNLAAVPARPVPPDAAARGTLSAGLAEDRDRSRQPLSPGGAGAPPVPGAGPPPPPRLAAAPPVRLGPAEPEARPVAVPAPATPAAPAPAATPATAAEPAAPPPPPPAELLAPPPPPSPDLLAPRRN